MPEMRPILELHHVPQSVLWRALDLMGMERKHTYSECLAAVRSIEADAPIDDRHPRKPDAFARAMAEFLSSTGAFHPERRRGRLDGGGSFRIVAKRPT